MRLFSWFLFSCLSLLYRKATAFYMLILFPAILLGVFISCKSFLAESLEILCMESYYLQIGTFFFTSLFLFISLLSCHYHSDIKHSTERRDWTISCSWSWRKCFEFLCWVCLAIGLLCIAFIALECVPSTHRLFVAFIMKGLWIDVNGFFCICWEGHMVSVFACV